MTKAADVKGFAKELRPHIEAAREMTDLSPPPFQRRRRPDYVGGDL